MMQINQENILPRLAQRNKNTISAISFWVLKWHMSPCPWIIYHYHGCHRPLIAHGSLLKAGKYYVSMTTSIDSASPSGPKATTWMALNGTAIPNSAATSSIPFSNSEETVMQDAIVTLAAGDKLSFYLISPDAGMTAAAITGIAPVPNTPSISVLITELA